jgi:thiosulfate dehydrogenase
MPRITIVAYGSVAAAAITLMIAVPRRTVPEAGNPSPSSAAHGSLAAAPPAASPIARAAPSSPHDVPKPASSSHTSWAIPDVDKLPDNEWGRTVRHGRDLIAKTYAFIGPEVSDVNKHFAGNNLACQNCHLDAGTRQFGQPFRGVFATFPNYRARSGKVGTIEDRIQGCMTRSMNGKPLPPEGPEITALVAYMKFLSDGRPIGSPTPGRGSGRMPELSRAANPEHGKVVYAQYCASCHGPDGQGQRVGQPGDAKGYTFPPLWGDDSFNNGAGMDRLIAAANFIHSNMPAGTTWQQPVLSSEDAWDVAAYVQAQPRPQKANLDRDYPVRSQKPVDNGYGPYADRFSQQQHKLGPFGPIRNELKSAKSNHAS